MDLLLALIPSILIAALSWYLAWAGSRDRLPRNAIIGIRLAATTRSDRAWYAAHRAAVSANIGAGIWFLLGGLGAAFLADSENGRAVMLFSGWAIAFVWVAVAVVLAVRAAKAVEDTEPGEGDTSGQEAL